MALIGYARVSTQEQNLDLQRDALEEAGCELIFEDEGISAIAKKRPYFEQAIKVLKPGDVFVVWKMDRAFRSLKNALDTLEDFENRNIALRCLTEPIDTTPSMGKFIYQIRHVFAELERNLIRERTIAGMEAARKRGVKIGRPRKLSPEQIDATRRCLDTDSDMNGADLATAFGVSRRTISRAANDYAIEN